MKDYGLVSIITPTWNSDRFISETIESVLSQTYQDWELIIVDDCSTDNTKEIVEKYLDPRIKYSRLGKNSGAAIARNIALRIAKGKWIAFIDSDDLWLPEKLESQLNFMVANNYSFTYHKYCEIDENGNELGRVIAGPKHISRLGVISYCWMGCLTVMYNRTVVGEIQIPSIQKNNDYAMWLLISKKSTCHLLDASLARYRRRTGSISNDKYLNLIKWHYRLFRTVGEATPLTAGLLTVNNIFWGVFKKVFYIKDYIKQ